MLVLMLIISDVDNQTIEKYYLEMNEELMKVAYSILQDRFDAETAVQDAFVRIMTSIESFHHVPDAKKNGYCYMVVRNMSIDMYNKERKNGIQTVMLEDSFVEPEDVSANVEMIMEVEEETAELYHMLDLLDETFKRPLMLRYAHGLSYKQISETLHISEALARKRVERAISKLLAIWKEGNRAYV